MLEFAQRARVYNTDTARIRRYRSNSDLVLCEVKNKFGYPTRWLVIRQLANGSEEIISQHRSKAAALRKHKACVRGARNADGT